MEGSTARRDRDHVDQVFRDVSGQAVATLVRIFGDITLAEDAVQDAFVTATVKWTAGGIPPNPAGWIVTTARNRAIDITRRAKRGRELLREVAADSPTTVEDPVDMMDVEVVPDDQLRLMFTCCHPSLRMEHQVALTLRLLGGLSVDEIARSFVVTESTMAKRIVRAKYKIKAANIPYRIPSDADLPGRLASVLAVIYLIYNTGADDAERGELRADAIRLGRSLADLMPDEPEVAGLLALMLLSESRAGARILEGHTVTLDDQDRTKWDRGLIEEGQSLVRACVRRNRPGLYQLQATIQAIHADAATSSDTDWNQIVSVYDDLMAVAPTPVVAMNRAIAVGESDGAVRALAELDVLEVSLARYHLFHATRGNYLEELGHIDEARRAFEMARDLAHTPRDVDFLTRRIETLDAS